MNDLLSFGVALTAVYVSLAAWSTVEGPETDTQFQMSERSAFRQDLSFGWQRAQMLGTFFNGVFLLALGISIFLQSLERFITLEKVEEPKLVLIIGCVGLAVNTTSAIFLHRKYWSRNSMPYRLTGPHVEHHDHGPSHNHSHSHSQGHDHSHDSLHDGDAGMEASLAQLQPLRPHAEHKHTQCREKSPGRDLNMLGVMIHVMGDALNNVGVIIAALVIWKTKYEARYYADPATGMGISLMIFFSSIPLVKNSGTILLQSAPRGVDLGDVKHDIEKVSLPCLNNNAH
jgi:zinc transporter 1